jgi:hypothetical protein
MPPFDRVPQFIGSRAAVHRLAHARPDRFAASCSFADCVRFASNESIVSE